MTDRRHASIRVALAATLALAGVAGTAPVQGRNAEGLDLLHVPVRWCALRGSRTAQAEDPDKAILRRLRRGSAILAPQIAITLRSAVNRRFRRDRSFPIINDPRVPNGQNQGDVLSPTISSREYQRIIQRCADRWDRLDLDDDDFKHGDSLAVGPVGVVINEFVDRQGRAFPNLLGYAWSAHTNPHCATLNVRWAAGGSLMIEDVPISRQTDRRLVAHEVGHVLNLQHGNGKDDSSPPDGLIDKYCDPSEDPDVTPGSLMTASLRWEKLTPWQRTRARRVAKKHGSVLRDPPMALEPVDMITDDFADELDDVRPEGRGTEVDPDLARSVDLAAIAFSIDLVNGQGAFIHSLVGSLRTDGLTEFVVTADADPSVGDVAASIPDTPFGQYPTESPGVDFVTSVVTEGTEVVDVRAWRFDGGDWQPVFEGLDALVLEGFGADEASGVSHSIVVTFGDDPSFFDGWAPQIGVIAVARAVVGPVDAFPDFISDGVPGSDEPWPHDRFALLSPSVPPFPVCSINGDSGRADPGEEALLEVSGLGDGGEARATVWFSDLQEPLDGDYVVVEGELVAPIPIPTIERLSRAAASDALDGDDDPEQLYVVSVELDGTALTADCPVLIGGAPLPDVDE